MKTRTLVVWILVLLEFALFSTDVVAKGVSLALNKSSFVEVKSLFCCCHSKTYYLSPFHAQRGGLYV